MVHKKSKRGLNTGNTLRKGPSVLKRKHTYGFVCIDRTTSFNEPVGTDADAMPVHDLDIVKAMPDREVEYSLKKKQRWRCTELMKETLTQHPCDETNVKISLTERYHRIEHPSQSQTAPCFAYHENTAFSSRVSKNDMPFKTAKQPIRDIDSLSKKEKRRLWRTQRISTKIEEEPEVFQNYFDCHITHGAPNDGRFHKDCTKYLQTGTSMHQGKKQDCRIDATYSDFIIDDDHSLQSELDEEELTASAPAAITYDLAEFLISPEKHVRRKRRNTGSSSASSGSSDDDSRGSKGELIIIPKPYKFKGSKHTENAAAVTTHTFNPKTVDVVLKKSDLDLMTLKNNLGDKFRESYSTPRSVTFDLSERVKVPGESYLVACERATTDGEHDRYRLFCSGTFDYHNQQISTVESGSTYNLTDLLDAVVEHINSFGAIRVGLPTENKPLTKKITPLLVHQQRNWKTQCKPLSKFSAESLKQQLDSTEANIFNHRATLEEFVFIPTQYQRSTSCTLQCGVCFETLNDMVLHSALLPCQHFFCDECWSLHISGEVMAGNARIVCPEFECKTELDLMFILAHTDFSTYKLHREHLTEVLLWSNGDANWCPEKRCGRVMHCRSAGDSKEPIPMQCECGTATCFRCGKEPHWPLTCDQLEKYHDRLTKAGVYDSEAFKPTTVIVRTKPCPQCNYPIEKDGGCVHMTCGRCHTAFCWQCGQKYIKTEYYHDCKQGSMASTETEFTSSIGTVSKTIFNMVCDHRMYRSYWKREKLKKCVKNFKQSVKFSHARDFLDHSDDIQTINRFINQTMSFNFQVRLLLEFCCAVNLYRKNGKLGLKIVNRLAFSLDQMEHILNMNCTRTSLDRLHILYKCAKESVAVLIGCMSKGMGYT